MFGLAGVLFVPVAACERDAPSDGATAGNISPAADSAHGISLVPELDEEAGAVILPSDRVMSTFNEQTKLTQAGSIAMAQCARPRGVVFIVKLFDGHPIYDSEQYFGPWTEAQARQFGFVMPSPAADLVANGIKGAPPYELTGAPPENLSLTEADYDVLAECEKEPEAEKFRQALGEAGPWVEELATIAKSLRESEEAKALFDKLGACYRDHGLTPYPEDPSWPVGGRGDEISEAQIELALKVVECKDSIDFTQRMATLEAQMQAPIITKYAEEMLAQRQVIDKALTEADKITEEYRQSAEYKQRQGAK